MMTDAWKDTTSYSRDDKDRVPPCWSLASNDLHITVLAGHRYYPDDWVMLCHTLGIDTLKLGTKADMTEAAAKAKALQIALRKVTRLRDALTEALDGVA